MMPTRAPLRAVLLTVLAVGLAGCVSVPTTGPIEAGGVPSGSASARVEIEAAPPVPGATPGLVVEGFLHAMSSGQGNYDIARQYLAEPARTAWQPQNGVIVYDDSAPMTVTEQSVVLEAPLEGRLGPDGGFVHSDEPYRIDFGLVQQGGQWRISNPPQGLLVSEYLFDRFFRRFNLYFFDPTYRTLVADPIYLDREGQSASALMRSLLSGPTDWSAPGVVTALPEGTQMTLAAPVGSGVVDVSFNDAIANLNESQRSRLAAQVVWTLSQLDNVTGVRLLLNDQRYPVPEQGPDGVIPVDAFADLNPVPSLPDVLYVATRDGVGSLDQSSGTASPQPLESGCAAPDPPVTSMAVSADAGPQIVALADRAGLVTCQAGPGNQPQRVRGLAGDVSDPQFTRFGELWATESGPKGSTLVIVRDGLASPVRTGFDPDKIRAMRVSPDGTRLAMIRWVSGRWQLGVARINRNAELRVEGWRPVVLSQNTGNGPMLPTDVTWADGTTLLLLAAEGAHVAPKPYEVQLDGADLRQAGPGDWAPRELASRPRDGGSEAVVVGTGGTLWRYQDDYRWPVLANGVEAAAYPS